MIPPPFFVGHEAGRSMRVGRGGPGGIRTPDNTVMSGAF